MNISRHPLLKASYEHSLALEELPASEKQTALALQSSAISDGIDKLLDTNDALRLDVAALRTVIEGIIAHCVHPDTAARAVMVDLAPLRAALATTTRPDLVAVGRGELEERFVNVARGCLDYAGGHRGKELEIFHHGIQTVINAIEAAAKNDPANTQVNALARIGAAATAKGRAL